MLKKLILSLITIGVAGGGYVYVQSNDISLAEEVGKISQEKIKETQETTKKQVGDLSAKAKEVGEQTKKILGESVKVDEENSSSLQDRAIEYGQYLYCKQVVNNYETE